MTYEKYRITLEHYYVTVEPDRPVQKIPIESPLVVETTYDRTFFPNSIVLNEMMDRMKEEVLTRAQRRQDDETDRR